MPSAPAGSQSKLNDNVAQTDTAKMSFRKRATKDEL